MDDKASRHQLGEQASSNLTPMYLRMNSTKSEVSEKEATDSGCISDYISRSSVLSEDNLNPADDLPHDLEKPLLLRHHSHFDSGVVDVEPSGVEVIETLSSLKISSDSYSQFVPSHVPKKPDSEENDEKWMQCYSQYDYGNTLLHIAVVEDTDQRLVQEIVQAAPTPVCLDVRNDDRQTALHLSVLTGQAHIVRYLVLCNANYRKCDSFARTPLHCAVGEGKLDCVQALTNPITSNELAQITGLKFEHRKCLKNETINNTDSEGLTCVHSAALVGSVDIMKQLVWSNADINAKEWKSGMTALHMAVERQDVPMVQYLLSVPRIDLEAETFAGFTPYQICYDEKIAAMLLEAGADNLPHAEDENDMSADMESDDEEEMCDSLPLSSPNFHELMHSAVVH